MSVPPPGATYLLTDIPCGRIPRKEVERIAKLVMKELEVIQPGCSHTIAGGYVQSVPSSPLGVSCRQYSRRYRRGKAESNDIDIVITHPKADRKRIRELCQALTDVLSKKGLITHLMCEFETNRYQCAVQRSREVGMQHSWVKTHQRSHTRTFLRRH